MTELETVLSQTLVNALTGGAVHLRTLQALEGLHWFSAGDRPGRARHSVFRTLNHMSFWQDAALAGLRGAQAPSPERNRKGWPGEEEPGSSKEWEAALARFRTGLEGMIEQAQAGGVERVADPVREKTALQVILSIANHNSYHLGQIVLLRRQLASWPPPSLTAEQQQG